MPTEGREHQHHVVSARLAREAFRAAADPARFPEQIAAGLRPWQAAKIYEGGVGGGPLPGEAVVKLVTGERDPLLGMSAQQFGVLARSRHLSQSARQMREDPGTGEAGFRLLDREPKAEADAGLLDGLDVSLRGLARFGKGQEAQAGFLEADLAALEERLRAVDAAYDARAPEKAVPPLAAALLAVRKAWDDVAQSRLDEAAREELLSRLDDEERETAQALALAQGLVLEARLEAGTVVPGHEVAVAVSVFNQGPSPVPVDDVALEVPGDWSADAQDGQPGTIGPGQTLRLRYLVKAPASAAPSGPYWSKGARDRYDVTDPGAEGLPWSRPLVAASLRARVADAPLRLEAPAVFRYAGEAGGEKQHELRVVPALSVDLAPSLLVFSSAAPRRAKTVSVRVVNRVRGASKAVVRVTAPAGYTVTPPEAPVELGREGEDVTLRFQVSPPATLPKAPGVLRAVAVRDAREHAATVQEIAYPHVETRQRLVPAEARVLAPLEVRTTPGAAIGYVTGSGDAVPEAVAELGLPLSLLGPEDLAFADLSRFTTIVIGVRAYEVRPDLRAAHARLLKYVEAGGHLLVQYQRAAFNGGPPASRGAPPPDSPYAPWPAAVTARRVTDETAPIEVLAPGSAVLREPNAIGPADWEGWVQERAIQLLDARDPRYQDLLAAADPFPLNAGTQKGLLVEAKLGRGTWTYTGLVLFRQLPEGNPGAYRLLANLLGRPRAR
jgi:hypothetical protein